MENLDQKSELKKSVTASKMKTLLAAIEWMSQEYTQRNIMNDFCLHARRLAENLKEKSDDTLCEYEDKIRDFAEQMNCIYNAVENLKFFMNSFYGIKENQYDIILNKKQKKLKIEI